ncbi:GIY-YIG nuclease family protein [uncultured Jannaschia sp.]|uniref:GIY-YIG nuclease family protein n=1 Tax=uncultured Jannaschia sp. TaxID=293347 RepID=UPI0026139C48|nr:GIY-YIG nuclease family protein [uncultured Jannaschia sp.]
MTKPTLPRPVRVSQKWGFGLSPEKPETRARRMTAARRTIDLIKGDNADTATDLEALSESKGLFSRAYRQDQWDWFIVWSYLGRPPNHLLQQSATGLGELRKSLKSDQPEFVEHLRGELQSCGVPRFLGNYLTGRTDWKGGVIYVLSSRSQPEFLKIGYTTRDPILRASEINAATAVLEPFGVRAAWTVEEAARTEKEIHRLLDDYRVRQDREFFNLPFREAFEIIGQYVRARQNQ